jgi:hypothetical protein
MKRDTIIQGAGDMRIGKLHITWKREGTAGTHFLQIAYRLKVDWGRRHLFQIIVYI